MRLVQRSNPVHNVAFADRPLTYVLIVGISVALGLVAGHRIIGEGYDFQGYLFFYEYFGNSASLADLRFEPGFLTTVLISKSVFNFSFPTLYVILVSVSLALKLILMSRYNRPVLTCLFYLCIWYPIHEYTQIRIAVALAFALVATEAYLRGRLLIFAAYMMAAVSFHVSTVLLAVLVPLASYLARYSLTTILLSSAVAAISLQNIADLFLSYVAQLIPLIDAYTSNYQENRVNIVTGVNILTVALLSMIVYNAGVNQHRDRALFIIVVGALVLAVALHEFPVISHRLREMLLFFIIPLAFNAKSNTGGFCQYIFASALAGYSLYETISLGVIGNS